MNKFVLILSLLISSAAFAQTDVNQRLLGVSLRDIQFYIGANSAVPGINSALKSIEETLDGQERMVKFHGAYLQSLPVDDGYQVRYKVLTLARLAEGRNVRSSGDDDQEEVDARVDIFEVSFDKSTKSSFLVSQLEINPYDLNFSIEVGLAERKVLIKDTNLGLKIVLPVGVGSFDDRVMNNATTLLTPRFKSAYLSKGSTISKRHKPRYFADKPFIRIVDGITNEGSAVGFHTEINDSFVRGFDSHGCMRLRDSDLYMMHDLVVSIQNKIPMIVAFNLADKTDHPAPKRNKSYKAVQNDGTLEKPRIKLDVDNLMQTILIKSDAPVEKLVDVESDHMENLYQYDSMGTYNKQRKEDIELCKQTYSDESDIKKCINDGARKLTLKQKIYRWWVH